MSFSAKDKNAESRGNPANFAKIRSARTARDISLTIGELVIFTERKEEKRVED